VLRNSCIMDTAGSSSPALHQVSPLSSEEMKTEVSHTNTPSEERLCKSDIKTSLNLLQGAKNGPGRCAINDVSSCCAATGHVAIAITGVSTHRRGSSVRRRPEKITERELLEAFERVTREDSPTPKRENCLDRFVIQQLAAAPANEIPIDEQTLRHIGRCWPCLNDIKRLREKRKRQLHTGWWQTKVPISIQPGHRNRSE
jgi:hypothetical protein